MPTPTPRQIEQYGLPPSAVHDHAEVACTNSRRHYIECSCPLHNEPRPMIGCRICNDANRCAYCCHCRICTQCNRELPGSQSSTDPRFCRSCNLCTECSRCVRCIACESHITSSQECCSRCRSCCNCSKIYCTNPLKFHDDTEPAKAQDYKRYLGAEIEIANYHATLANTQAARQIAKKWSNSIVYDGSLRGENCFEINTSPARRDKFQEQINQWGDWFRDAEATVNGSCGLHVHIDTSDFSFPDMKKFILLYNHLELAFYSLVSKDRRKNSYCEPCSIRFADGLLTAKSENDIKEHILMNIYGYGDDHNKPVNKARKAEMLQRAKESERSQKPSGRYKAVNLHGWIFRKAVEIRLGEGSKSPDYIINWTLLWEAVFNTAYFLKMEQISDLVKDVPKTTETDMNIITRYDVDNFSFIVHSLTSQLGLLKLIGGDLSSFINGLFKKKFLAGLPTETRNLFQ